MCSYFCAHCNSMFVSGSWAGKPGLCPACGGAGCFSSGQHKPPTTAEIEELKQLCANYANPCCGVVEADVWKAFNALPRLLSLLTTPTDAAVREAVEEAEIAIIHERHLHNMGECCTIRSSHLRTLLRAVQAPRLTGEQVDELATCVKDRGEWMAAGLKAQDECNRAKARVEKLEKCLEHAVEIAEGKQHGGWDDLLQYRAALAACEEVGRG